MLTGMILLWQGSIATIPNGYHLCDGTNGTPDLRDMFVMGAGTSFAVDQTGGENTHDHPYSDTPHSHTIPSASGTTSPPGGGLNLAGSNTGTSGANGVVGERATLPPWYALCYIMKT